MFEPNSQSHFAFRMQFQSKWHVNKIDVKIETIFDGCEIELCACAICIVSLYVCLLQIFFCFADRINAIFCCALYGVTLRAFNIAAVN